MNNTTMNNTTMNNTTMNNTTMNNTTMNNTTMNTTPMNTTPMNTTMKFRRTPGFSTPKLMACIALALTAGGGLLFGARYNQDLAPEQQQALQQAYQECCIAIDREADALEQWYISHTSNTGVTAHALTGWKAKRMAAFGSDEEMKQYAQGVIQATTFSLEDCKRASNHAAHSLADSIAASEDNLAETLDCYSLSVSGSQSVACSHTIGSHSGYTDEMKHALYQELGGIVTGEVLTQLATQTGIIAAGGAFSLETFGISLAVGVGASIIVDLVCDSEGDVKDLLDREIRRMGAEQKKAFKAKMTEYLNERRKTWEHEIRTSAALSF